MDDPTAPVPPPKRVRGPDKKPRKRRTGPQHARATDIGVAPTRVAARQSARDSAALRVGRVIDVAKPSEAADDIPEDVEADMDDLAATVVKKTQRLLAAGKVQPTLRDGLSAQQLLDRRAEKAADRQFMLNLAVAMAGGGVNAPDRLLPAPEEPKNVTEGEYEDMDLAPAHLRRA